MSSLAVTTCEACLPLRPQSQHWPAQRDERRVYVAGGIGDAPSGRVGSCPCTGDEGTSGMVELMMVVMVTAMVVVDGGVTRHVIEMSQSVWRHKPSASLPRPTATGEM